MEFLTNLLDKNTIPWITAMLLGFMTAISPCPLATNITAIGFISRDIAEKRRVLLNGLFYTLGRTISYTVIALVIILGADQLKFSGFFQKYGEKLTGPVLIFIGLVMLNLVKINFPAFSRLTSGMEQKKKWRYADAVLLGIVFALAFCPYSGVLFFGILIPLAIKSTSGLYLPVVFSAATAVPVIIISWLLAYMVSGAGKFYDKIRSFEKWFRWSVAALFIVTGTYYILRIYLFKQ
jgi:cytochrome c biogenesis protein CcdA